PAGGAGPPAGPPSLDVERAVGAQRAPARPVERAGDDADRAARADLDDAAGGFFRDQDTAGVVERDADGPAETGGHDAGRARALHAEHPPARVVRHPGTALRIDGDAAEIAETLRPDFHWRHG